MLIFETTPDDRCECPCLLVFQFVQQVGVFLLLVLPCLRVVHIFPVEREELYSLPECKIFRWGMGQVVCEQRKGMGGQKLHISFMQVPGRDGVSARQPLNLTRAESRVLIGLACEGAA